MTIPFPDRIRLARLPTPLVKLERTSDELGVEIWLKRDDLTELELSGNKVRKLEFLLADARALGADTVITCGGEQSNHCRATAFAATRLGMRSLLLLRVDDPDDPPPPAGNILLDRLAGAEIQWISRADWQRRSELMAAAAERLGADGRTAYVIGEGGSDEVGAWGYIGCAGELAAELADLPRASTSIVHACGSGGTTAGLALGTHLAGLREVDARPVAINVCDDHDYFVRTIDRICGAFTERYGLASGAGASDVDIVDGHVGRGYSLSRPEELATLRDLARREGIVLDPVYSGKAFHGMVTELAQDRKRFGDRIVFVHTGGLFGLLPRWAELAELL